MQLLTAKLEAGNNREEMLLKSLIESHKFEISVPEVFGPDFSCEGVYEWITDKPKEVFTWLRLPHSPMYIEYIDIFKLNKSINSFGLLVSEENGVIQANPVLVVRGTVFFESMTIKLGISSRLTKDDFGTLSDSYNEWYSEVGHLCDYRILAINHGLVSDEVQGSILSSMPVLLESLLYINSKGIGTTVNYPKIKKGIKRKSALTEWTYKTLRVIKKGDPKEIHNRSIPSKKRIPFLIREMREHSVRGHIAVYTEEKPLFGNPKNVGPIWISPHIRCRGTEGKVIKDYEII